MMTFYQRIKAFCLELWEIAHIPPEGVSKVLCPWADDECGYYPAPRRCTGEDESCDLLECDIDDIDFDGFDDCWIDIDEEDIRLAAYYKWVEAGRPVGQSDRFWYEALNAEQFIVFF